MRGWGSGVFDAGQIRHRNVQYPASFNTRKIKELEIVSLLTAPNLPASEVSTEGTFPRGLLQVPGCAWPSLCLLVVLGFFSFFLGFCCCSFLSLIPYSSTQIALRLSPHCAKSCKTLGISLVWRPVPCHKAI